MKNKKRLLTAGLLAALPLIATQAVAAPIPLDDWGIDLTGLNPTTVGATTYSGLGALTHLHDITVSGQSTVTQNLNGAGSSLGESFSESGYLSWVGAKVFPTSSSLSPAIFGAFLGTNDVSGFNGIYFEWNDLTGTVTSAAGDIVFDTGAAQTGTMSLYLDLDGMNLGLVGGAGVGDRLELASFGIVPISGGSDIGVDGGAFPSGTVGLTMEFESILSGVVFTNAAGTTLDSGDLFEFIDVDATLSDPATFCTGSGGTGLCSTDPLIVNPGTALSFIVSPIQHEGSTVIAVPEPNTLMLLAAGLMSLTGGIARRKR